MYTLKSVARRGTLLGAAFTLVVAAVLPASYASADALNPLTERSLTLSSSSPGWSYTDGSENSTYAPPNSGANGQKAANYFSFKVSTDTSGAGAKVKAFSFQYCTTAAGDCLAPGDNLYSGTAPNMTRNADSATKSDLNVTLDAATKSEVSSGNFSTVVNTATGALQAIPGYSSGQSGRESAFTGAAAAVTGNYLVYYYNGSAWVPSSGWVMNASNSEILNGVATGSTEVGNGLTTGKNNYVTLTNSTGQGFAAGAPVKVMFFANEDNYLTNPGSKEFFVRINTYSSDTVLTDANILDGGVTVANVMNQSIWIQTKVLETMDFSVGTVNPDTLSTAQLTASEIGGSQHGPCSRILTRMTSAGDANVLKMGDPVGEYSLRTDTTYSTHSYWRLSSNSSAGATVYYSGHTLTNTSGDQIEPIGPVEQEPSLGAEQFGLAIANGTRTTPATTGPYEVDYDMERASGFIFEQGADATANGLQGATPGVDASWTALVNASKHDNRLWPLVPEANYDEGAGVINTTTWDDDADNGTVTPEVPVYGATKTTKFAFDNSSNEVPVAIASENNQVVDCVTAKMRYIANIAATTPAGIYTTKINYIASPQY